MSTEATLPVLLQDGSTTTPVRASIQGGVTTPQVPLGAGAEAPLVAQVAHT
jgi:hypothetical protein